MKSWHVSAVVDAEDRDAANFRNLLPRVLGEAGFKVTQITTVEAWMCLEIERVQRCDPIVWQTPPEMEHTARQPTRRKGLGPDA